MFLLLTSKLRRKLLTYSFTHPDETYYVRELSHLINEDPGNLSRELKRLEADGLFTSVTKGRLKFFSLNRKYPLFKELKEIIFKTEGVQGSLKELVRGYGGDPIGFHLWFIRQTSREKEFRYRSDRGGRVSTQFIYPGTPQP